MTNLRTILLILAIALQTVAVADWVPPGPVSAELLERAQGIHQRVITLDTHVDFSPLNFSADRNYLMDLPTQVTLPKMEQGGLDVGWFIVYVGQGPLNEQGYAQALQSAMEKFRAIHWMVEELAPDRIALALNSDDVRRIHASGKRVAMIGVENAFPLGTDLANIERFHALGARYLSLAHNGHSQFADSHTGELEDSWLHQGLSDLGRAAIVEMNRLGIMIDLSHPSREANRQTLALSRAPVIASHTVSRTLNNISRNMDDETMQMVAEAGGVVQTTAFQSFLNSAKDQAYREEVAPIEREIAASMGIELLADRRQMALLPVAERIAYLERVAPVEKAARARAHELTNRPVDVADLVDHIDYMVQLIGIDHVGISSDFDGGGGVWGWFDASETFNVTLELVRRGYSEEEIGKLWSGNLLRVLDQVQALATLIQAE